MEDFEEKSRFYKPADQKVLIRPHRFTYQVWFMSMSLRYFFEMALFTTCVIVFQYFISIFNYDLH
jgi:hypothetical protein